jgi:hypothetical protein
MLGETLVGARLRDVRSILRFLRNRPDLNGQRIAVWGDSFAPANSPDRNLKIPLGIQEEPAISEPIGGLLALLSALYEEPVKAVYARGGLTSFGSVLESQFCYLPHDVIVPGALTVGDLTSVAAALAPRPVRLEGLVDGLNRLAGPQAVSAEYEPARQAYTLARSLGNLVIGTPTEDSSVARWLLTSLSGK